MEGLIDRFDPRYCFISATSVAKSDSINLTMSEGAISSGFAKAKIVLIVGACHVPED
jgi:hypothetical protein